MYGILFTSALLTIILVQVQTLSENEGSAKRHRVKRRGYIVNCTVPTNTSNRTLCKLALYQTSGQSQNKDREIAQITAGEANEVRLPPKESGINATVDDNSPSINLHITEATCDYAGSYICEVIQLRSNIVGRNVKNECQKVVAEQETGDSGFALQNQSTFIEVEPGHIRMMSFPATDDPTTLTLNCSVQTTQQVEWLWERQTASGQWLQIGNATSGERANDDNACWLHFSVLTVPNDGGQTNRVVRCYVLARNHSYVDLAAYLTVPFGVKPEVNDSEEENTNFFTNGGLGMVLIGSTGIALFVILILLINLQRQGTIQWFRSRSRHNRYRADGRALDLPDDSLHGNDGDGKDVENTTLDTVSQDDKELPPSANKRKRKFKMCFPEPKLESQEKFPKGNRQPQTGKKSKKKKGGKKGKGGADAAAWDTDDQGGAAQSLDTRPSASDTKLVLATARKDCLTQSKNSLIHIDKIIREISMEAQKATARLLDDQKALTTQAKKRGEVGKKKDNLTENETQKSSHAPVYFPKCAASDKSSDGHRNSLEFTNPSRSTSPKRSIRSNHPGAGHNGSFGSVKSTCSTSQNREFSSTSPRRNHSSPSKLRSVPYSMANPRQRPGGLPAEYRPTAKEKTNPNPLSNTSITFISDEFQKSSHARLTFSPERKSAATIRTASVPSEIGHLNASRQLSDDCSTKGLDVRAARAKEREVTLSSLERGCCRATMQTKKRSRSRIPHRITTSRAREDDQPLTGGSSGGNEPTLSPSAPSGESDPTSPLSALAAKLLQNVRAEVLNSSSAEKEKHQWSGLSNKSVGELRGLLKSSPLHEPDLLRVSSTDGRLRPLPNSCGNIRHQLYSQNLLPVSNFTQAGNATSSEWSINWNLSSDNSSQISGESHTSAVSKQASQTPVNSSVTWDILPGENVISNSRLSKTKIRTNPSYRPTVSDSGQLTVPRTNFDEELDSFEKLENQITKESLAAEMNNDPPGDPSFCLSRAARGLSPKTLPLLSSQPSTGDINTSGGSDGDSSLSLELSKRSGSPHRRLSPSRHCHPGSMLLLETAGRGSEGRALGCMMTGADGSGSKRPGVRHFLNEETARMPREGAVGSDTYRPAVPKAGTDVTFSV